MTSVFIVGNQHLYKDMFHSFGWKVTDKMMTADIIQFTGGIDVNPALYKETPHRTTNFNVIRDNAEMKVFKMARHLNTPMAGICRGAQFLNVMCGGKLWQDVDGHALMGVHRVQDSETQEFFNVTSTHHQMIRPTHDAEIVLVAAESKKLTSMRASHEFTIFNSTVPDVESCYYEEQKVFCFQPHPEFTDYKELAGRYLQYLNKYLKIDPSRPFQYEVI